MRLSLEIFGRTLSLSLEGSVEDDSDPDTEPEPPGPLHAVADLPAAPPPIFGFTNDRDVWPEEDRRPPKRKR